MVGVADIPCVGKFVDRISEATVDAVFRGLRYMFFYKSIVNELNSDIGKLNIEKDRMSRKVQEEHSNGKVINDHVLTWQKDVEEIQKSDKEVSPSCSCIQRLPIPNPVSRFQIGRNAAKKARTVTELTGSGKVYLTEGIAHLPPVKSMPKPATTFEEFQSRKDVYKKLWDTLVNEDSPVIHGIYGMAGVGKTRMMEQIWEDAMKKNIFNKVVRVNVGNENSDKLMLQEQIASRLNCKLESQDVESRASQLENSLRNWGKILLVLDDIWEEVHLNDIIGTSFGDDSKSKGSKILLTSREKDVCLLNKCEHIVKIKTLSPDEALYLFMNTVGSDTMNSLPDESLVRKVCDECGHLPLLIHAVGKALKGKLHNLWEDAYNQLKKGKFDKIVGVNPQVYTCIKLSIDNLKDEDAKTCLFLCSLFPEDANIDMKMLIQLATGSQLIPDGELRVLAMVDYLKESSLLLDSGKDDETKVHDIIRDVARSVAFTDSKYAFLHVTCSSGYLPSNANYHTRKFLRLDVKTADVHFDEHLVCPDLHTLWLQSDNRPQQFSGGFFSMFVNLSCLLLQNMNISLEQFSLQPLGKLETLSLLKCDIRNTDGSLYPKSLKSLCIYECALPRPLDVANLRCLRKLEIQNLGPVLVMENIISSLSYLEELHIPHGFIHDYDQYHLEPIVMEISKLSRLKILYFKFFEDEDNIFRGTDIFSNIDGYNILVGSKLNGSFSIKQLKVPLMRSIELWGYLSKPWEGLMARAEIVNLYQSDAEVSSICNGHRRVFEDLKILRIYECNKMGHLASTSPEEIHYSVQSTTCFSKLTNLEINQCSEMKYLFCDNIAKSLLQLQELTVMECPSMEAIIMNEGGRSDGDIINFSQLKSLNLKYLPRLTSFYVENSCYPAPQYHPLFNGMVAFPSMKELTIRGLSNTTDIWGEDSYSDTVSSFGQLNHLSVLFCEKLEAVISHGMSLHNLEHIHLYQCNSLRTIFPLSFASGINHLKSLVVFYCAEVREIIEAGEQVITDVIVFPELTDLQLGKLPKLKSFCGHGTEIAVTCKVLIKLPKLSKAVLEDLPDLKSFFRDANFEFHLPALKKVEVYKCVFSTLFTGFFFNNLKMLEELRVYDCDLLEDIFEDERGDETLNTSGKIITLNRLSTVDFEDLPKFKNIFYGATYKCYMPTLKNVTIIGCGLSVLFTCSMFREIQHLEELLVSKCELLEQIVEEVGGDKTSEMNGKSIKSPKLSSIILASLPNLKSFSCTSSYVFNMPKLQKFRLIKCPKIEYFSFTKANAPLVQVSSDWGSIGEFQDLNDYVRHNHERRNHLKDCAGESSYTSQDLGTQSEKIEEEKPQETEIDQPDSSV